MNTRGLYRAYIVTPVTDDIATIVPFIARDDANAQMKAVALGKVEDVDKVVVIVERIGTVPTKKDAKEAE